MSITFLVEQCPREACIYNLHKRCKLSGLPLNKCKNIVINQKEEHCAIKRQLNEHKMNVLLGGSKE